MFFPYQYWDRRIERYDKDNRIYGDANFGRDFARFFNRVNKLLTHHYRDKIIDYVNPPRSCILDRNKEAVILKFKKGGLLTPRVYQVRSLAALKKLLGENKKLYIKAPFGSMGKGLTYLTRDKCATNFIFRNGKIISPPYDYNWHFTPISRRRRDKFLSLLIKNRFMFEEAIEYPHFRRRKFDMRVYAVYGKVPYFYARSAPLGNYATNWSQGGRIEKRSFLRKALKRKKIDQVISMAKKASRILDLSFVGVDVLFSNDREKAYLLEAQSFPGYERGFNLMKYLAGKL